MGPGQVWNRSGPDPAEVSAAAGVDFTEETMMEGWKEGEERSEGGRMEKMD